LDPFSGFDGPANRGLFGSAAPVRRDCLPGILARTPSPALGPRTGVRRPTLLRLSSTSGLYQPTAPRQRLTPERTAYHRGHPRGVSAPKTFWRNRQLNPRNVHFRGYVSPIGFLNLMGGYPGLRRQAVCFTRPPFLGFRLPGACASGAVHLSMNPLPSCRYFSALFPSEEWKTTGSSVFRAFFPLRVGMPLVHGRSPELKFIRAPA
jgi:hypothetical protein